MNTKKDVQPVFKVTVEVSMLDVIDGINETSFEDEAAYIEDEAIQAELTSQVVSKIISIFDRDVLNKIQALAQAEIKAQLSSKIPKLIDNALEGPASKFPEMSLEELLIKTVDDQFAFIDNDNIHARDRNTPWQDRASTTGNGKSKLHQALISAVNKRTTHIEGDINKAIVRIISQKTEEYAQSILKTNANGSE